MASIDKRPNGNYRIRWRETPGATQKTRTFERKKDAVRFLDHIRGDLARGMYIDPDGGQIPFQEYAEEWRAAQMHRRNTAKQVETYLRLHAYPTLGNRPLGAVRRSEIQLWVKNESAVLAPGSVEVAYRWVASIFKAAMADRLIPATPCIRISLPKRERREVVPLEVAQVEAMAEAVNRRYRPMIIFTAGMGLRPGEVFGLTTDRVDFVRRQVRVDRQLLGVTNNVPEFGPPKSDAGYRTVPMPDVVSEVVATHLDRFRFRKYGLVFTNTYGDPLRKSTFSHQWRHAATKAGLPDSATFHDLRHFYASLLIAKGCSIKAVQKRLGHQSALETLDTYSHLWPDSEDETREAVDGVFDRLGHAV